MACQVANCRFPNGHITPYHKCGNCGMYGHGRVECDHKNKKKADPLDEYFLFMNAKREYHIPDYTLINDLYKKPVVPIDLSNYCTIKGCPVPDTHNSSSHQKDFDEYATHDGPDNYGIRRNLAEGKQKVENAVKWKPGTYAEIGWGMGKIIYATNINNKIEIHVDDSGNPPFIHGLKKICINNKKK